MDPKIWSNIPPNLLEVIFSRLPLQSLVQIRNLTKQWRSDFTSPIFQRVCSESRPMGFAVVESEKTDPKRVWVYDALARSWHALPLAYLPFSYLVAADGGLFCFVKYSRNTQCLQVAVMNPLTCECRELPPALGVKMFPKSFQMKVDMKTRHYTIKFLGTYQLSHGIGKVAFREMLILYLMLQGLMISRSQRFSMCTAPRGMRGRGRIGADNLIW